MRLVRIAAISFALFLLGAFAAKEFIEYKGRAVARMVIADAQATAKDPVALAVELTRRVYISYQNSTPQKKGTNSMATSAISDERVTARYPADSSGCY